MDLDTRNPTRRSPGAYEQREPRGESTSRRQKLPIAAVGDLLKVTLQNAGFELSRIRDSLRSH